MILERIEKAETKRQVKLCTFIIIISMYWMNNLNWQLLEPFFHCCYLYGDCIVLACASELKKDCLTIGQIYFKLRSIFKDQYKSFYNYIKVYGLSFLDKDLFNCLKDYVIFESEFADNKNSRGLFNFLSAINFCKTCNIVSVERLNNIYLKMCNNEQIEEIEDKHVNSQKQNALLCFQRSFPLQAIKEVIKIVKKDLEQEKRNRDNLEYFLTIFSKQHWACCVKPFMLDRTLVTSLKEFFTSINLDYHYFCYCLINCIIDKKKSDRNILLWSKQTDVGKTTFCRQLVDMLYSIEDIGTLSFLQERFFLHFAYNKRICFTDDVTLRGFYILQRNRSFLDGITPMPVDKKYGEMQSHLVCPQLLTSNVDPSELKGCDELFARITPFHWNGDLRQFMTIEEIPCAIVGLLLDYFYFLMQCKDKEEKYTQQPITLRIKKHQLGYEYNCIELTIRDYCMKKIYKDE